MSLDTETQVALGQHVTETEEELKEWHVQRDVGAVGEVNTDVKFNVVVVETDRSSWLFDWTTDDGAHDAEFMVRRHTDDDVITLTNPSLISLVTDDEWFNVTTDVPSWVIVKAIEAVKDSLDEDR